ncbi:hypothetical protein DCC85_05255 [Paenibacillus sp. CAA11]|nr:hypothetical protein DCC85_05255 [Paenibacillus sp. CAA11]
MQRGFQHADEVEFVQIQGLGLRDYGCMLEQPTLLFSEEIRTIMSHYTKTLPSKNVMIMDSSVPGQQLPYFLLDIQEISAVGLEQTTSFVPQKQLKFIVNSYEILKLLPFFKLTYLHREYVILRLNVAEHILRHSLYGIAIDRITIEEIEESEKE